MMPERNSVLVVCTANTCRSPMGEALLRHALAAEPEPLNALEVLSAGIAGFTGDPVTENSAAALKKVGLDISGHRSRRLMPGMIDTAVAIYAMTPVHLRFIREEFPEAADRAFLFRSFLEGEDPEIPDPFGQDFRAYEATRDAMVEAIPSLIAHLRSLSQ